MSTSSINRRQRITPFQERLVITPTRYWQSQRQKVRSGQVRRSPTEVPLPTRRHSLPALNPAWRFCIALRILGLMV